MFRDNALTVFHHDDEVTNLKHEGRELEQLVGKKGCEIAVLTTSWESPIYRGRASSDGGGWPAGVWVDLTPYSTWVAQFYVV